MKAIPAFAVLWIGALCFVSPMSAHARGGGGHSANSGTHAGSQNQAGAAKSQTTNTTGNKQPSLNSERKGATTSAAKTKKGKAQIHEMHINKTIDKASP